MGIYIKDMEMPTAGMCKTITIFDDRAVVEGNGSEKLGIAVPVPSHGRLIDADALRKKYYCGEYFRHDLVTVPVTNILYHIDNAQIVIPADKDGET